MNRGLVHLYYGDGKGKTTAAMGLALRALGRGKRVVIVQFLKDGSSGEIGMLRTLGAVTCAGKPEHGFAGQLTEAERECVRERQTALLRQAAESDCELLILDEACAAVRWELLDPEALRAAIMERPENREIVLTGREPPDWMLEEADYCTEMRCVRHPYESGVTAREGIEY